MVQERSDSPSDNRWQTTRLTMSSSESNATFACMAIMARGDMVDVTPMEGKGIRAKKHSASDRYRQR